MNKTQFLQFVDLYHLGGVNNSVKFTVKDKVLTTSAKADDNTLVCTVTQKVFDFDDITFGINDTVKLRTLLRALGTDLTLSQVMNGDRLTALNFVDTNGTELQMMLADLAVIQAVPNVKVPADFDVEIPIDEDFVARYISAKNALGEVDTFTFKMNKKNVLELVIGWAPNINTDQIRVAIKPTPEKDKVVNPISFNANYLRAILSANSEAKGAVLKVSTKGLAMISFETDQFTSVYYLIQKKLEG